MRDTQRRARAPWVGGAAATAAALAAGLVSAAPAAADDDTGPPPAATVTGPIDTTEESYPFMSPEGPDLPPIEDGDPIEVDLGEYGYVEEEYFVSGIASHYNWYTGEVDDTSPYTTRIVVRRPAEPADFDGTTVMEWNNVSFGQDIEVDWSVSNEYFMRNGHIWVGVSAQRVGVDALRGWDPDRYGDLDVGGPQLWDAPSFDIFSQVARALRSPESVDPLPGFDVGPIIATGHSQSAGYLANYHNYIHPHHGEIDAFLIHGSNTDLDTGQSTPVLRLMAEGDVRAESESEEPDTEYFRRWEVAGSSHVGFKEYATFAPLIARDVPGTEPPQCDRPPFSRIPFHYVQNAAYDHLATWIAEGEAPPQAPRLEWDDTTTPNRDGYGNRLGGIRLAEHEVATALNDGDNSGDLFCFLLGAHIPFDEETLQDLYPTRLHYVPAVYRTAVETRRDGYILAQDARATRRNALRTSYPWWR